MLKIKAGKFYRTRDGQKVGPMRKGAYGESDHPFDVDHRVHWVPAPYGGELWSLDGKAFQNERGDLIAEWPDAPDLTKITTAFGLLDRETRQALMAHGGPYEAYTGNTVAGFWETVPLPSWQFESTYRVKPAPPKPQERWVFGCWAYEDKSVAREAIRLGLQNGKSIPDAEIDAMLTLYREVLPE